MRNSTSTSKARKPKKAKEISYGEAILFARKLSNKTFISDEEAVIFLAKELAKMTLLANHFQNKILKDFGFHLK